MSLLRILVPIHKTLPRCTRLLCTTHFRLDASTSRPGAASSSPAAPTAPTAALAEHRSGFESPEVGCPPAERVKPRGKSKTPPKNRQRAPLPPLDEKEVEEEFMRGRGPGGQVINKSSILVSLLHVPTGLRVKCQETRSRETNRLLARRLLRLKVDQHLNGAESRVAQDWERERRKKEARKRKAKKGPSAKASEDGVEIAGAAASETKI